MDIIIEKDFKIEEGSCPARYNLYLASIINKGKEGKERVDWKLHGYDMHMDVILRTLSHLLTDKEITEPVDLNTYLKLYQKTINNLVNKLQPNE